MTPQADAWSDLLTRVATDKDAAAFQALYDHFAPRLKSRLMRNGASPGAAEDVVQEAFIKIWRKASSFDPSKASAAAWIFTIARNMHIDSIRKSARPEPDLNDPSFVQQPHEDAGTAFDAQERAVLIRQVIKTLPDAQQTVLFRSYFDEETHNEIAESLKLPIGTVKSRIRLALQKLHDLMPQYFKDDLS